MRKLLAIIILTLFTITAIAEAPTEAWVMCNLKSEVIVRTKPDISGDETARVYPGDRVELDGGKKKNWFHVLLNCESGEGWIRGDHLSFTEPVVYEEGKAYKTTRGKLSARKSINGEIVKRIKKAGTQVTVYMISEDWAVTSAGYIKSEFLEAEE